MAPLTCTSIDSHNSYVCIDEVMTSNYMSILTYFMDTSKHMHNLTPLKIITQTMWRNPSTLVMYYHPTHKLPGGYITTDSGNTAVGMGHILIVMLTDLLERALLWISLLYRVYRRGQ